jgi:hypothetical protein
VVFCPTSTRVSSIAFSHCNQQSLTCFPDLLPKKTTGTTKGGKGPSQEL